MEKDKPRVNQVVIELLSRPTKKKKWMTTRNIVEIVLRLKIRLKRNLTKPRGCVNILYLCDFFSFSETTR